MIEANRRGIAATGLIVRSPPSSTSWSPVFGLLRSRMPAEVHRTEVRHLRRLAEDAVLGCRHVIRSRRADDVAAYRARALPPAHVGILDVPGPDGERSEARLGRGLFKCGRL